MITAKINYPKNLIPENAIDLVIRMTDKDNRIVARNAKKEMEKGQFTDGLILAVKKAIQEINKAEQDQTNSQEIRIKRILTITDSTGKAKARKG